MLDRTEKNWHARTFEDECVSNEDLNKLIHLKELELSGGNA